MIRDKCRECSVTAQWLEHQQIGNNRLSHRLLSHRDSWPTWCRCCARSHVFPSHINQFRLAPCLSQIKTNVSILLSYITEEFAISCLQHLYRAQILHVGCDRTGFSTTTFHVRVRSSVAHWVAPWLLVADKSSGSNHLYTDPAGSLRRRVWHPSGRALVHKSSRANSLASTTWMSALCTVAIDSSLKFHVLATCHEAFCR